MTVTLRMNGPPDPTATAATPRKGPTAAPMFCSE